MRYRPLMRGRPEIYPVKVLLGISEEMDAAITSWRRQQPNLPNRNEAIRLILAQGLAKSGLRADPDKTVAKAAKAKKPAELPERSKKGTKTKKQRRGPDDFKADVGAKAKD